MGSARITDIRPDRRGSRARVIYIDDDPWRTTSASTVGAVGIAPGDTVDLDNLSASIDQAEPGCARTRALALLHYRDHSHAELCGKLQDDGFPITAASSLAAKLERLGLLDDVRLATNLARSLASGRSYGRSRVLRELARRGIPEDLAQEAADAASCDDAEHLTTLATRYAPAARGSSDRLAARLIRRGFAPRDVFPAARAAIASAQDTQPDGHDDSVEAPQPE